VSNQEVIVGKREDWRRIGLLLPSSSTVQEREFSSVLPHGMTLHVARLALSNIDAESTLRIVAELDAESRKLADADVDAIALPTTAPSARKGLGYDRELIERITAASGKPATTASTALIAALRVLASERIVLGAPWSEAVNEMTARFIEASGFRVLAHRALGHVRNLDVGLLDDQTAYDVGLAVDRPDADVVVLACGNWSTFGALQRLEQDLGKPVLSTNQVTLWHVLDILRADPLPGLGTLLRDHLPGCSERQARTAAE
jgi:maleate cis-trans isomerase